MKIDSPQATLVPAASAWPDAAAADPLARERRIDSICDVFEAAWREGRSPRIEDHLPGVDDSTRRELLAALFAVEFSCRVRRGEAPRVEDYLQRFPDDAEHFAAIASEVAKDRTVAQYQLLQRIGVGSFASVYLARDTRLQRTVALKLSHGHWNEHAEAAFEREARAVAQLDHPHIVRVFDFGRHEFGPQDAVMFIAAQYVAGPSLKEWLPGRPTDWREAARLCALMAAAVHHAHQRGVIHRDLKPANIILDERGEPHITDFGLAKWSDDATLTGSGDLKGTPAYMSPEQALGNSRDVTIQSDVYALGVILYELLTGSRPFEGTADEVLRRVRGESPRPPRRLYPAIPPDLEIVCLKALAKEPAGRYATAEDLAADLGRVRRGEPIQARPVGRLARLVSWSRREPRLAASTAAAALLLATAAVVATISGWRVNAARDEAVQAAAKWRLAESQARKEAAAANRLSESLVQLVDAADPMAFRMTGQIGPHPLGFGFAHDGDGATQLEAILASVTAAIDGRLKDRPEVRARLLEALANGYRSLGQPQIARPMYEEAIQLRQQIPDARARRLAVADAEFYLAWLHLENDQRPEAKALFERVAAARAESLGKSHHPEVIAAQAGVLATILADDSRFGDLMTQIADLLQKLHLEGYDARVLAAIVRYFDARNERLQHHFPEAQRRYDEVLEGAQAILGDEHPVLAMLMIDAAGMRRETGDYQRAEALTRRGLSMARKFFGAHPKLVEPLLEVAGDLVDRGDFDEGLQFYREAIFIAQRYRRDNASLQAQIALRIGDAHMQRGDVRQAVASLSEALRLSPAAGEELRVPLAVRDSLVLRLGEAHLRLGDVDAARGLADDLQACAERQRQSGEVGQSLRLAGLLRGIGRQHEADRLMAWALASADRHWRAKTSLPPQADAGMADVLGRDGRWQARQEMLERALGTERSRSVADLPRIAERCRQLALAMIDGARRDPAAEPASRQELLTRAEKLVTESVDIRDRCFGPASHYAAESQLDRAQLHLALGRKAEARADAREALALRRQLHHAPHPFTAKTLQAVSDLLRELGDTAEADKLAQEAQQMLAKLSPAPALPTAFSR